MPLMLRYHRETGAIVETWESNSLAVLQAQQGTADLAYGYVLSLLPLSASTVEQGYLVREGELVARVLDRKD